MFGDQHVTKNRAGPGSDGLHWPGSAAGAAMDLTLLARLERLKPRGTPVELPRTQATKSALDEMKANVRADVDWGQESQTRSLQTRFDGQTWRVWDETQACWVVDPARGLGREPRTNLLPREIRLVDATPKQVARSIENQKFAALSRGENPNGVRVVLIKRKKK